MTRVGLMILVFALALAPVAVSPQTASHDVGQVTTDVEGHHAAGSGTGATKAEAVRLAKAEALSRIFAHIGKDELFQQIFISTWPEAIDLAEVSQLTQIENGYAATVRVTVDQTAVLMTEEAYRVNVVNLLNRAEAIVRDVEEIVGKAESAEENLRLSDAFTAYRQARARAGEAEHLLRPIRDSSVLSDAGNSAGTLRNIVGALATTTDEGLARLEDVEAQATASAESQEAEDVLQLLEEERAGVRRTVSENRALSPFYDLPAAELQRIATELYGAQKRIGERLRPRYQTLQSTVSKERMLLREKISLALADLDEYATHIQVMIDQVELEIRNPRLARQERMHRRRRMQEAVGKALRYLVIHPARDVVVLEYELPFEFVPDNGFSSATDLMGSVTAERAFDAGVWLRTRLERQDVLVGSDVRNIALSQEAAIGFFRNTLIGVGLGWDWDRRVGPRGGAVETVEEYRVRMFLGGVDRTYKRSSWLLSFRYGVPRFAAPFITPYHLNADLSLAVRIENAVRLRAGVSTGAYQTAAVARPDRMADVLGYRFAWRAEAALRLPPPFILGFGFTGRAVGDVVNGNAENVGPHRGVWKASVGYSF
jgi:hypothetical protein